jgi:ankyrin repeat protein
MLEIDKLILTAIEKDCIDVVEVLLKNRDKLCDGSWSDDCDDQEWRSDLLGKIIELEKVNPNLPLKEGFLKKAEGLFNAYDILYLYVLPPPPDHFDKMDIPKDLIKHYLSEASGIDENVCGWSVLILAVCAEDKEMVEALLEFGANANICVRHELSGFGINANINENYDGTVLGVALEKGSEEIIKLLLKYGARASDLIANLPESFEYDNSPLMLLKNILSDMRRFEDIGIVDKALYETRKET